jgi:thymidylate synthase (FAD)
MNVKLVSHSQGTDGRNLLEQVAFVARVSNPANQDNNDTAEKLVRYLIKHQHWSPLEMVNVCLEINTTRDIARQILRHRSFSFQEFSQRYAVVENEFEYREARLQDYKNRQKSIETDDEYTKERWQEHQAAVAFKVQQVYDWAIKNGIAKEQARVVLPEGMTPSRLYMNGTLRSWVHYIQLRSANGTQKEHQEIAIACAKAIEPIFPMIEEFVQQ